MRELNLKGGQKKKDIIKRSQSINIFDLKVKYDKNPVPSPNRVPKVDSYSDFVFVKVVKDQNQNSVRPSKGYLYSFRPIKILY